MSFFIIWKKFDNSPDLANEQGSNDLGLSYNTMVWDSVKLDFLCCNYIKRREVHRSNQDSRDKLDVALAFTHIHKK